MCFPFLGTEALIFPIVNVTKEGETFIGSKGKGFLVWRELFLDAVIIFVWDIFEFEWRSETDGI